MTWTRLSSQYEVHAKTLNTSTSFGVAWETLVFPFIKTLADLEPQTLITALVTLGGLNIDFSWIFTALLRLGSLVQPWAEAIGILASQMHRFVQIQTHTELPTAYGYHQSPSTSTPQHPKHY